MFVGIALIIVQLVSTIIFIVYISENVECSLMSHSVLYLFKWNELRILQKQ